MSNRAALPALPADLLGVKGEMLVARTLGGRLIIVCDTSSTGIVQMCAPVSTIHTAFVSRGALSTLHKSCEWPLLMAWYQEPQHTDRYFPHNDGCTALLGQGLWYNDGVDLAKLGDYVVKKP